MDAIWKTDFVIAHTRVLARSFRKWTGRDLLPGLFNPAGLARSVFEAPFVLVSYGIAAALALWEMSWEELTRTPSRLTAEAPNREERAKLLEAVARRGFIDDYSGVRISKTGRHFRISRATVWNLLASDGNPCGQSAMFDRWEFI